jgi:hypothetical protein|tara:strand:+ start:2530 stop:2784 length:255 start_codon:yes stop_codon:yes gene_type:complete
MKKGMELVMIKLEVCYACELFEPVAKQISEDRNVVFKTIKRNEMIAGINPTTYPHFLLYNEGQMVEQWGGIIEGKLESTINKYL